MTKCSWWESRVLKHHPADKTAIALTNWASQTDMTWDCNLRPKFSIPCQWHAFHCWSRFWSANQICCEDIGCVTAYYNYRQHFRNLAIFTSKGSGNLPKYQLIRTPPFAKGLADRIHGWLGRLPDKQHTTGVSSKDFKDTYQSSHQQFRVSMKLWPRNARANCAVQYIALYINISCPDTR